VHILFHACSLVHFLVTAPAQQPQVVFRVPAAGRERLHMMVVQVAPAPAPGALALVTHGDGYLRVLADIPDSAGHMSYLMGTAGSFLLQ